MPNRLKQNTCALDFQLLKRMILRNEKGFLFESWESMSVEVVTIHVCLR